VRSTDISRSLSLTKDAGLQVFAECWATEAGYASVIFDYRNSGGSDGASRNTVSLTQQHEDYRAVLRWVREQPDVFRTDKIVVMGCGVSGLAISRLAVEDRRLAGVMMMAPALDGMSYPGYARRTGSSSYASGLASWLAMPMRPRLAFWAAVDWVGSIIGCMPVFVPAVGRTGEFAVVNTPMSYTRKYPPTVHVLS
jgi:predicted acyl esterase